MSRATAVETQPIDRLEEKVNQMVSVIDSLRAEKSRVLDESARLQQEITGLKARLADLGKKDGQGLLTEEEIAERGTQVGIGAIKYADLSTSAARDYKFDLDQMVSLNIRHLPVLDNGKVVGIVSIRDLTKWASEELAGGHEMPDIARSQTALKAASELQKQRQLS